MRFIAKINEEDRKALFHNTAMKMGMTDAIVEKDFWVCYMLDYLFHRCKWKNHIAFKGGTSLSKAFGLIERFSEDIDLILDWRVIGYDINEPWEKRSNTKQDKFNEEANKRTIEFLKNEFVPLIQKELAEEISPTVSCYIDEDDDPQTVIFKYDRSFEDNSILPVIRLEIGALAAWTPAEPYGITSYAAQQYPKLFKQTETIVQTVLPQRTFWEKVTILHREANRSADKEFPTRYSRHYYDLYCMHSSFVLKSAFDNIDLLEKVVKFKEKFYRCPWAKYEDAKIGTIKLLPPDHNIQALKDDYKHMQNMIYGNSPDFESIMQCIGNLEKEINELK